METMMDRERLTATASETLSNDGVCVLKNAIASSQMMLLNDEIDQINQLILTKLIGLSRPLKTHSDIAERQLGRLDYRCGFTADIFSQVAKPIVKLIQTASPTIDFHYYWGVITAHANAGPTDWHRDVYPILNTTKGQHLSAFDLNLPPYYFTVLMPLVPITVENGPTEFIKGTHRLPSVALDGAQIFAPLLQPGDLVIFEGRLMHRGQANQSNAERRIAYITFIANWYNDQTFVTNQYLFPELATVIY